MIRLSRMADYAVLLLSEIAAAPGRFASSSGLSAATALPEPTVAKVLKILAAEGLVESARGANGGYRLVCGTSEISAARIITAVDGPIGITGCVEGAEEVCRIGHKCRLNGCWDDVNEAIRTALENVSLEQMLDKSRQQGKECAQA